MGIKFSNNAYTTLTSSISAGDTSFDIASAASLPVLGSGDWTYVSLTDEVVKVTAITGLTCTCEPTTGSHSIGISVELRMTAELLNDFASDTEAVIRTSSTGSGKLPIGTTAQRDGTPSAGFLRFNSTDSSFEGYNGTAWGSIGGGATGGGSDAIFYENAQSVTTDYTITSGNNAMSAGPVTINAGVTVTVPTGSNWVIV